MQAVKEITYPCKFDGSQQPAMFYQAKGPGPRPLLVALHTWSGDHTQAGITVISALRMTGILSFRISAVPTGLRTDAVPNLSFPIWKMPSPI